MITIRKASDRKHLDRGWNNSYFTFSFADYSDPAQMGFRALRVINEDTIAPSKGFGPHAHRDMEILTYVLEGKLLHRDSMGEQHVLGPNEIQMMSAGSGVVHSEFNASETEPVHLFQIWILPAAEDLVPSYQQISFTPSEKRGHLRLLAAPERKGDQTVTVIRQDASIYAAELGVGESLNYSLAPARYAWIQAVKGNISLNGQTLAAGDAAALTDEPALSFEGMKAGGEFLLFDFA
jgi:redox-sensitive bicupin YhaK (pirin superfamily)